MLFTCFSACDISHVTDDNRMWSKYSDQKQGFLRLYGGDYV